MNKNRGSILILVLVFGSMFLFIFTGLINYILLHLEQSRQKAAWNQAIVIAEAGLNYYRWHLAHDPDDLQDGQAWCCATPPCSVCGPYEHDYADPQGGVIGKYSLEVESQEQCGETTGITITSTGWDSQFPETKRKAKVRYIRPSVADYAYLLNDNVWAGADREIKGPYHSNGGIRMDGENKALVTSAREDWLCTSSFGCSPNATMSGVFTTANGNEELFDFPVPPFDFGGITMDLAKMKTKAQGGQGVYLPPSGEEGYHIIFINNGTFDLYEITELDTVSAYSMEDGWHNEDSVIDTENFLGNYNIPNDCGLVFIEDNLWAEGVVSGKITSISADLINPLVETDVWLINNIEYTTKDGSDGLVLFGQHNNLIGLYVPDNMELHGIFIAQTGHFGRNHYPSGYNPFHKRASLEIFGSVVSNGRVGTKWGNWASGFNNRENIYDPKQSLNPPAFLPTISEEQEFKNWEEVE